MKLFSFIFIFYLLFLSWQPCQDLQTKEAFLFSSDASQNYLSQSSQADETEDCSPFCVCSCCHVSTTETLSGFSISRRYAVSTEKRSQNLYRSDYYRQYLESIWQPPKFNFTT